ncbi:putative DNA (cytosine-5-)-methyltransferase [Vibrio nigripulchritudo SOn1]|uniref:DNA (Cytosine-5-)-methyltransferase n=1 Tax=Vibrio nigripulchritudo SOn1 TaxID=1238450 RepID=A0AAV2VHR1_9VIBR|nr:DNA cytosine methyltransferase [Vibrio nigripulchritudo]CCO44213.1 putative DNA (cytosine-5-)-methyltransferase [Vibrio nigripulchritudo SOn1]
MEFIKRIHQYSVKHLSNGAARIYIRNGALLEKAGYYASSVISVRCRKHRVEITLNPKGDKTIMNTARGPLLELRNKDIAKSFAGIDSVILTVRRNRLILTIPKGEQRRLKREDLFAAKLISGKSLLSGSLFSGIGLLAYALKQGLSQAGITTCIQYANDSNELALDCNLSGNQIWDDAAPNALATSESLGDALFGDMPEVDILEIGKPCVNQSRLCKKEHRDLEHPAVGTLFVQVIHAVRRMNPSVIVIENATPFINSKTFDLIERELSEYRFECTKLTGFDYGDYENRERACIVGVSSGLPNLELNDLTPPMSLPHPPLKEALEPIALDSPLWREMVHVKRKEDDERLNFKNTLHSESDTKIGTLTASYSSPKVGAPMLEHPLNKKLQRQFTAQEHCNIRALPSRLGEVVMSVANGIHPLISTRGSTSAVHRLNGNSVTPKAWVEVGAFIGRYLNEYRQACTGAKNGVGSKVDVQMELPLLA